ncbi:MAG TPA: substrate-binding domain-containing protein [Chloroflexota bacterium]|nr:substrate-binding domain-containing protein [Chloroflexota bacterium]
MALQPLAAPAGTRDIFPPWQHDENNDALNRGLEFTVPEVDNLPDFHGDITNPQLVLYVGGNYFFAMAPLVAEFEREHPEYKGRLYWETIPPGLLVKQMEAGGTITSGNMTWTAKPDAYFAGLDRVKSLIKQGLLEGPAVPYVTNTLAIMTPAENPARVTTLADLGKADIRLVMPNPEFEGVTRLIQASLRKAGGDALNDMVYKTKVADGSTVLTQIHHRQTPLFLMLGRAAAGVTWKSEAIFQEQVGNPISHVDIPPEHNSTGVYAGAAVKGAPHPAAARLWLAFIRSQPALAIFSRYGMEPYTGELPAE